jgi:hypothetical protein
MKRPTRKTRATRTGRRSSGTSASQFPQGTTGSALSRGRDTLSRAYDWAHEAAGNTRLGSLRMPRMPRRSDMMHLAEANPLILGAVGLGLGVAIATLFPRGLGLRRFGRSARSRRTTNGSTRPAARATARRRRKGRTSAKARTGTAVAS